MNFKERKKRRNLYLIIVGTLFVIFLVKNQLNMIRTGLNSLVLPIKILIYKGTETAKHTVKNLQDIDRILKENQELKKGDVIIFASVGAGMNINAIVYKV